MFLDGSISLNNRDSCSLASRRSGLLPQEKGPCNLAAHRHWPRAFSLLEETQRRNKKGEHPRFRSRGSLAPWLEHLARVSRARILPEAPSSTCLSEQSSSR